jgi:hypothetical protein
MKKRALQKKFFTREHASRLSVFALLSGFVALSVFALFLIKTKEYIFDAVSIEPETTEQEVSLENIFPLGVDPLREVIVENPQVETYLEQHISANLRRTPRGSWFDHTLALLTQFAWYQNLASPISRILVVDSGERHEEITHNFSRILGWNAAEKERFASLVAETLPTLEEGKYFPGKYVVNKDASPEEVAAMLLEQFSVQVLSRYPEEVEEVVPLKDALTIASLLEREAYDFEDMRHISGIIWNRLFIDMKLQLDASLQYAKADQGSASWWPKVEPKDKYIDSAHNTYKHKGLPPTPIANPSIEAILAALNPKETDCLFYFHDQNGGFHCTKTYEEHVALLRQMYGSKD